MGSGPVEDPQLTVIMPGFNCGHFITESITTLSANLSDVGILYESLAVDDASTDDTAERFASVQDTHVKVLRLQHNCGKGAAIKEGLKHARAQHIVFTDDDIPYGTEAVLRCHQILCEGTSMVIGDRTLPESRIEIQVPLARRFISSALTRLLRLLPIDDDIRDTQCGLKGLSAQLAHLVCEVSCVNQLSFDLELLVIASQNGIPITRMPVVMRNKTEVSPPLIKLG